MANAETQTTAYWVIQGDALDCGRETFAEATQIAKNKLDTEKLIEVIIYEVKPVRRVVRSHAILEDL